MNFSERMARFFHAAGDDVAAWVIFLIFAGVGASAMGLGVYLRSGGVLTVRAVVGVALHSLLWGIVVFLVGYSTLKYDIPMLLGLSILSGIGTASVLDVVLMLVKARFGINVTFTPPTK
ncbi:MAG: hypothetical protein V4451_04675 [Pseudomonadota bacterium]